MSIDDETERSFIYGNSSSPAFAAVPEEAEFESSASTGLVGEVTDAGETFRRETVESSDEDYIRSP
jgi:hypothetical protein